MNNSTIRCVVTAGPTREYLDPVRYFSNASSGRMGYGLAEAARDLGWQTLLISGPTAIPVPDGVECRKVVSAEEMLREVSEAFTGCDVLILCAAVADYRPARRFEGKLKKEPDGMAVGMEPTPDIAAEMGKRKDRQIVVGFAAETENLEEHAVGKLHGKNLDWIVANDVGGSRGAMESSENEILMLGREGGRHRFGPAPKREVARFILRVVSDSLRHAES